MPPKSRKVVKKKAQFNARKRQNYKTGLRNTFKKQPIYYYKRHCGLNGLVITGITAAVAPYGAGYDFRFNQIPNSAEFVALYDQYSISCVVIEFVANAGCYFDGGMLGPRLHTVVDFDDENPPLTVADVQQYQNYKMFQFTANRQRFTRKVYPRIATPVYQTNLLPPTFAYQTTKPGWVDMTYTNVPHYGVKVFVEPGTQSTTSNLHYIDVYATFYFKCKNVR